MRIKNWKKFQHYKKRRPPWIKLYHEILDCVEWHELDGDSAKHLIMLWLIASESDGELPPIEEIAFRLRVSQSEVTTSLKKLQGWLDDASNMLATCYQHARPETETEAERETEQTQGAFALFWDSYPRKIGKPATKKAWAKIPGIEVNFPDVLEGVEYWKSSQQWQDPQFIPYPATFLNQRRWEDKEQRSTASAKTTGQRKTEVTKESIRRVFGVSVDVAADVQPALPSGDRRTGGARLPGDFAGVHRRAN